MTKILVCEGACSPATALYDAAIQRYVQDYSTEHWHTAAQDRAQAAKLAAAQLGRELVHTAHAQLDGRTYACTQCGAERAF